MRSIFVNQTAVTGCNFSGAPNGSVEGNSAGIFFSKVSPGKMNAYYFRRDKTAVLGAIKA